jgi:GMP synthase (glutamine-hydrolysing)
MDEIRLAVLLGGPMSAADTGSDKYPFLAKETALLHKMIQHDRPVLGIGLGAQLLAQAAGAKVYPSPTPEAGWHPITLPFPGGTEPIVMGVSDGTPMFHWHWEGFDVPRLPLPPPAPAGSALLCSTKACKNQAFRFKNRMFGFLFHMELTPGDIEAIVASATEQQRSLLGSGGVEALRKETETNQGRYRRLGDRIIRNFVQFTKTY